MVQLEEAKQILNHCLEKISEKEKVPLRDALGRTLAEDAIAGMDQPPFPRSPLDGYAVKGEDTKGITKEHPKQFHVIGKLCAGEVFEGSLEHGQAVKIMTGAPIPDGANTVIRQEWTDFGEQNVFIYAESKPYQDYCYQGEDYKKGAVLLRKGAILDGISIALLASLGRDEVDVFRLPKIAVISTGDELIPPGSPLPIGKIYDSNLYFVCARLKEMGISPFYTAHSTDSAKAMAEKIQEAETEADLIITTGGVSVGEKDIMHEVARMLDAKRLFWRVAIKPGAPTLALQYRKTTIICLSGNPFGAAANFELMVRGMIGKMTDNDKWELKCSQRILQSDFYKKSGVRRFLRGYEKDGKVWISNGNHASGVLSSMIGCNCLIEIPKEKSEIKKGENVWIRCL